MKCNCGYESDTFPQLKLTSRDTCDYHGGNIPISISAGEIYFCPQCGTLKIEVKNDIKRG
jgi:hypothetical protein